MLMRREKYNIFAWIVVMVICVSYLGVSGLYNPNIRRYSAHSLSSLGENRGIESGSHDMLMVDTMSGISVQTRNTRTGNSGEHLDDTWMLAAALAVLLQSFALCCYIFFRRYMERSHGRRWILLEYIHKKDGKKRPRLHWRVEMIFG